MDEAVVPLEMWSTIVPADWIDYNGHLTEGFYGVAFGHASDALLAHLGFDDGYRRDHGSFYTAETRIRFLREVHAGAAISVATALLAADEKRLHVFHDLLVEGEADPAATQESMMLHVARPGPRVSPIREPVLGAALDLAVRHRSVRRSESIGEGIRQLPTSAGR